jgi:hypothetical protein
VDVDPAVRDLLGLVEVHGDHVGVADGVQFLLALIAVGGLEVLEPADGALDVAWEKGVSKWAEGTAGLPAIYLAMQLPNDLCAHESGLAYG